MKLTDKVFVSFLKLKCLLTSVVIKEKKTQKEIVEDRITGEAIFEHDQMGHTIRFPKDIDFLIGIE